MNSRDKGRHEKETIGNMKTLITSDDAVLTERLREIVKRIVRAADPERVILFGSAARGGATSDSDIDILVVKRCVQRREWAGRIYRALIGVGCAVDIVVATPEDLERFRGSPATVIAPALRDGKVLYAA